EYMTDLHRRDDAVHNRIGQGDFPDNFPNSDRPLVALPHFPSEASIDTTSPDTIERSALGFDNAFSVPASETVDTPAGPQTVIVNPTVYGHGYLFNDLGKDGAVVYHEGTHSISTPIAGLEGNEGGALNEAQADLWAYTITDAEAIGEYVAQGARLRQAVRNCEIFAADTGCDANRLAWIRSVHNTLKYSQLGTRGSNAFEVHRDAVIEADRILYSTDPSNLDAPGQHEALIWQVFASHEMGINADSLVGGRQTISTRVPQFAADQSHLSAPQSISVEPASSKSLRVSLRSV